MGCKRRREGEREREREVLAGAEPVGFRSSSAMSGVFIDAGVLGKRLEQIYRSWTDKVRSSGPCPSAIEPCLDTWTPGLTLFFFFFRKKAEGFKAGEGGAAADALAIATGKSTEDLRYMKSIALDIWLFAYELPETLLVLRKDRKVHVVTGKTKAKLIGATVADVKEKHGVEVIVHVRAKGTTGEDHFEEVLDAVAKSAGPDKVANLGWLPKDKHEGAFFEAWNQSVDKRAAGGKIAKCDASMGFAAILAVKSSDEQTNSKKAAFLSAQAMVKYVIPQLETIIDEEKNVKHSTLSSLVEDRILEPSKLEVRLKRDKVNACYAPIVQSGGKYDLKITAQSNDDVIKYDTIVVSLGARYASYCSNLGRTIIVDPTKEQEKQYAAVLKAQEAAMAALAPGNKMSEPFKAAVKSLQDSGQSALVSKFANKYVGFGMGLEFKESSSNLSEKNERLVEEGMVFCVSISLAGIENGDKSTGQPSAYAMQVTDTVLVRAKGAGAGGSSHEVLTDAPKQWKDVTYVLNEEEEEEEEDKENASRRGRRGDGKGEEVLGKRSSALRDRQDRTAEDEQTEAQRREKQDELTRKANEETIRILTQNKQSGAGDKTKEVKDPVAYPSPADIPHSSKDALIKVDGRAETVLLPIYGVSVPFHISVIKNVTNSQDNEHSFVRIIFHSPSAMNVLRDTVLVQRHIREAFVKEISFRCTDLRHANRIVQEIKTMRRLVQQRESEKLERATLVKQEKLVQGRGRVPILHDVWIRPTLGGRGKKMTGTLEAHTNGFRYHSPKGEKLDVMYGNIKHAFFQPAEKEMICLIHFHLYNDIMVGKKKSKEVQLYTEVMDVVQTLDAGRRNAYDPDEIEDEQRERERRNRVNAEYNSYVKKVTDLWERDHAEKKLEFDIPFRELGFPGVPHKTTSFLLPTVYALVDLIETPFFVLTLSEVAVVNLERVGFGLKNFDMVFVFKDFEREPHRVDAIPSNVVEQVKEWLNSVNLKYYENKMNLVWKPILKTIKEDPQGFIEGGGWEFLNMEASEDEDEEEESEEFEPSASESESEEEDDDESDFDEDEEDSEEEEEEEDSEEGKTWEELEAEARNADRRKGRDEDEEEDRRSRQKRRRR